MNPPQNPFSPLLLYHPLTSADYITQISLRPFLAVSTFAYGSFVGVLTLRELFLPGASAARVDLHRAACTAFERAVFRRPAVRLTAVGDGTAPRVRDQASADEDQPLLMT